MVADHRIKDITLDDRTILWRSADVEQERRIAIFDLLEDNSFRPLRDYPDGYQGPYVLHLGVEEGRLVLAVAREDGSPLETLILSLGTLRRPIKDYFAICESYFRALGNQQQPAQIETIDMARRGIHNAGSQLLMDCLENKVVIDFETARRLFTLITALHIRG